jgi:hypothetical protein
MILDGQCANKFLRGMSPFPLSVAQYGKPAAKRATLDLVGTEHLAPENHHRGQLHRRWPGIPFCSGA